LIENYVVIDLEMTGLQVKQDAILEVGAARVRGGMVTDTFSALLNTKRPLSEKVVEITGITEEMAAAGGKPEEVLRAYFAFLGEDILVGQNIIFDYSFLKQWAVNHNFSFERSAVDTLKLARKFLPEDQKKDLASLCSYFEVTRENAHRALDDALETAEILERMKKIYGREHEADFEPKPLQYKVKKQTPATARQKQYLRRYAGVYGLQLPEYIEEMTRNEASRLVDQWIACYGRLPEDADSSSK
jgi:DNA polymerase-3 subunit alpha (Gram-positive type)